MLSSEGANKVIKIKQHTYKSGSSHRSYGIIELVKAKISFPFIIFICLSYRAATPTKPSLFVILLNTLSHQVRNETNKISMFFIKWIKFKLLSLTLFHQYSLGRRL